MLIKRLYLIPLLLVIGLMASCSVKTAYKQLDWVLAGMIEDYVNLNSAQEAELDKRIDSFLKWHQFTQLKIYVEDLQQVQQYTSMGMDDASAEDVFKRFMASWEALKDRTAPDMADLLVTLDEQQQQDLFENLADKNKEVEEEYKEYNEQERQKRASDKTIENFERWLGDLQPDQEALLRTWPAQFKPLDEERMAFRLKWQAALKGILAQSIPVEEKRKQLITLISKPDVYQTEEHKQKIVYNSKLLKKLILEFDKTVTQEQRGYLAGRLDYLIENFKELAAEQPSK